MKTTVTLKHANHSLPVRHEPFYDGWGIAHNGLITLPIDNVNHIRAAWFRGYQLTPDDERLVNFQALDAYVERVAAQESAPDSAESAGENDESDDTGRQPISTDGIRESQSGSSKTTTKRRTRSRSRSGSDS